MDKEKKCIDKYLKFKDASVETLEAAKERLETANNIIQEMSDGYLDLIQHTQFPIYEPGSAFDVAVKIHTTACQNLNQFESPSYRLNYLMVLRMYDIIYSEFEKMQKATGFSSDILNMNNALDTLRTLSRLGDVQGPDLRTCYDTMELMSEVIVAYDNENKKLKKIIN